VDKLSAVVLCGGESRRMGGADKALIDFGGRPLAARVFDALRPLSDDLLVVSNRTGVFEAFGVRVVPDWNPPRGPLGGIAAGLRAARHELALVAACDMPFLDGTFLLTLAGRADAEGADAVVPLLDGQYEPLHAVYRKSCLPAVERCLAAGDNRAFAFYDAVRLVLVPEAEWRLLDPEGLSLANVNTPDDLVRLLRARSA
jgi:molybdenum cofactor guanylyltransferase